MDQLELVFQLLVHLQFMYLQYNVYLSIVVHTNITILGYPSWDVKIPIHWEQFSLVYIRIHAASGTLDSLFILQYS